MPSYAESAAGAQRRGLLQEVRSLCFLRGAPPDPRTPAARGFGVMPCGPGARPKKIFPVLPAKSEPILDLGPRGACGRPSLEVSRYTKRPISCSLIPKNEQSNWQQRILKIQASLTAKKEKNPFPETNRAVRPRVSLLISCLASIAIYAYA